MLLSWKSILTLVKDASAAFIDDDALSHSAAISFYAATALAPIMLITIAIAGSAFGHDAAQVALSAQISGLAGPQGADLLEGILKSANTATAGVWASLVGTVTLIITASGVFGEMQSTLNKIWKVEPAPMSVGTLLRARALSLGLVAALGFLLIGEHEKVGGAVGHGLAWPPCLMMVHLVFTA